jgi:hypothetical protein
LVSEQASGKDAGGELDIRQYQEPFQPRGISR